VRRRIIGMETRESEQRKIFIVDDNITNLTAARNLLKSRYDIYPAQSANNLFAMLEKIVPDLILLDIEMPGMDGYETIRRLKADKRFSDIPVIFLTAKGDEDSEFHGLDLGAVDYILKPFSPSLLQKRVENHLLILSQREVIREHADSLGQLVRRKAQEILELQNSILKTVANLVEFRDSFTGGHTTNSQSYMEILLNGLIENGLYSETIINWNMDFILPSVQLHDVGMIAISDTILSKSPEFLTLSERAALEKHVTIGVEAVRRIMSDIPENDFLQHAINIVRAHHENWDGTGYPKKLSGASIPLEGRLMAIVNMYESMVSWRPYKKAFTHTEAVAAIDKGRGTLFDPAIVDVFLDIEDRFAKITNKIMTEI
jgi:putative two-component system response regulator